jgi:hypothetical protein
MYLFLASVCPCPISIKSKPHGFFTLFMLSMYAMACLSYFLALAVLVSYLQCINQFKHYARQAHTVTNLPTHHPPTCPPTRRPTPDTRMCFRTPNALHCAVCPARTNLTANTCTHPRNAWCTPLCGKNTWCCRGQPHCDGTW